MTEKPKDVTLKAPPEPPKVVDMTSRKPYEAPKPRRRRKPKPNEFVVAVLEDLLDRANAGEIQDIVAFATDLDGEYIEISESMNEVFDNLRLIGSMEAYKAQIIAQNENSIAFFSDFSDDDGESA